MLSLRAVITSQDKAPSSSANQTHSVTSGFPVKLDLKVKPAVHGLTRIVARASQNAFSHSEMSLFGPDTLISENSSQPEPRVEASGFLTASPPRSMSPTSSSPPEHKVELPRMNFSSFAAFRHQSPPSEVPNQRLFAAPPKPSHILDSSSRPSFGSFLQKKASRVPPLSSHSEKNSLEELSRLRQDSLSPWTNPTSPQFDDSIPRMFPQELRNLIEESRKKSQKPYLLIDLRTNRLQYPMIESAIPIPAPIVKENETEVDREFISQILNKISPSEQQLIIFYSTSGKRSDIMTKTCQKMGFENVKSLIGGSQLYYEFFGERKPLVYSTNNL